MTGRVGQVVLREAVTDDLPALLDLESAAFPSDGYRLKDFATALEDAGLLALVAEESETVVGFLVCQESGGALHLIDSVVAPAQRGRGIGGALVHRALEMSGARAAWAETRVTNCAARKALEALGFRVERRVCGYYDAPAEDALLLALGVRSRDRGNADERTNHGC